MFKSVNFSVVIDNGNRVMIKEMFFCNVIEFVKYILNNLKSDFKIGFFKITEFKALS